MRWLLILIAVVAAAGAATFVTSEGSPVRAVFTQVEKGEPGQIMMVGGLAPWEADATGQVSAQIVPLPELPVNEVPLDDQHRTAEEISEWLTVVISEALSFDVNTYESVLRESARHFHQSGYDQYIAFLQSGRVYETLQQGDLRMANFVQDTPFLLTKGAVDGRYKWLFEVPVMISYMRRDAKGYEKNAPASREVLINIQIARYEDVGKEGLLIESFSVKPKPTAR